MTDDRDALNAADRAVLGLIGELMKQSGLKMPEPPKTTQDHPRQQRKARPMTTYRTYFDRTDWRTMDTRALVEAARDSGHELAIALGERLEELDGADDALQEAREESRAKGERGVITLERLMREHGKGR